MPTGHITWDAIVYLIGLLLAVIGWYARFRIVEQRVAELWTWFLGDRNGRRRLGAELDRREDNNRSATLPPASP